MQVVCWKVKSSSKKGMCFEAPFLRSCDCAQNIGFRSLGRFLVRVNAAFCSHDVACMCQEKLSEGLHSVGTLHELDARCGCIASFFPFQFSVSSALIDWECLCFNSNIITAEPWAIQFEWNSNLGFQVFLLQRKMLWREFVTRIISQYVKRASCFR
jgi:hypothetical protein